MSALVDIAALEALAAEHLVTLVRGPGHTGLTLANYTPKAQYSNAWSEHPILLECRGIVFDQEGRVLCRPFRKFGNLGESYVPPLEHLATLGTPEVAHKLDGSMIALWFDGEDWRCTTRGSFTSSQAMQASLLWSANEEMDPGYTYLFEYIGPQNRIVVEYPREQLVLIGLADRDSGREYSYQAVAQTAWRYGWSAVQTEDGGDWATLGEQRRPNFEGFVLFWPEHQVRVKVKLADYVRLHRIIAGLNERAIWELLRDGQSIEDLAASLPEEFRPWIQTTAGALQDCHALSVAEVQARLVPLLALGLDPTDRLGRKTLAQHIMAGVPAPLRAALFQALDGKDYRPGLWKLHEPITTVSAFVTEEE